MSLAIIYARVSTEDQAKHGYSLPDQIAECRAKAKESGAANIMDCIDEGISGDVLERPGLTKARQLIRNGGVSLFVCYDPDRLARKLAHQLIITEEIEKSGCKLIFVNFDWKNTPEGRLFYSLRGAIAEFEKEKIKERTMRGLRQKAKQGGLTHDPHAFGYTYNKDANSLDILPKEAEVYHMMSNWFLKEELGYSGIATRLTKIGIPTKRGAKTWAATTVARMLSNPLYKGELWIQRYNTIGKKNNKYHQADEKVKVTERPQEQHVRIEVPHIIDGLTFEAHLRQAKRISRIYKKRAFHGDYLLSGLLRCEICGSSMSGTKTKNRRYYRCNVKSHNDTSSCTLPYLRAEALEQPIWETVSRLLDDPEALLDAVTTQVEPAETHFDNRVIKRNLVEATKERSRLIGLIQRGLAPIDEVSERMSEVAERITKLNNTLAEHQTQEQVVSLPNLHDNRRIMETLKMHVNSLDFSDRQRVIRNLVEEVYILPNEITIKARIPQ